MPCHAVGTAVLVRDTRELRSMTIRMQVVYQTTDPRGQARDAARVQTLRMVARAAHGASQVVSQNERGEAAWDKTREGTGTCARLSALLCTPNCILLPPYIHPIYMPFYLT